MDCRGNSEYALNAAGTSMMRPHADNVVNMRVARHPGPHVERAQGAFTTGLVPAGKQYAGAGKSIGAEPARASMVASER